jgi:hypothetical protein
LGESFSQRRRCVIRLTVATTLSHLLLEGPALATFAAAALKGTAMARHAQVFVFFFLKSGRHIIMSFTYDSWFLALETSLRCLS